LKVDGKDIASKQVPHTIPFMMAIDETFDVSIDTRTPVDDKDYQVPFRFTGKLDKLTLCDRGLLHRLRHCIRGRPADGRAWTTRPHAAPVRWVRSAPQATQDDAAGAGTLSPGALSPGLVGGSCECRTRTSGSSNIRTWPT